MLKSRLVIKRLNLTILLLERGTILIICIHLKQLQTQIRSARLPRNGRFENLSCLIMTAVGNVGFRFGNNICVAGSFCLTLIIEGQIKAVLFIAVTGIQLVIKCFFPACISAGNQQQKQ